jgi:DNA-binding NarL/FixJ family response regulator
VNAAKNATEATVALHLQLNDPLTVLVLCMNEIEKVCQQSSWGPTDRRDCEQLVNRALQQVERMCSMVKEMSSPFNSSDAKRRGASIELANAVNKAHCAVFSSEPEQESLTKRLTKRQIEVLDLVSEGYSNKQGALRMNISPRTFESHRTKIMRKFKAKNAAELVRKSFPRSLASYASCRTVSNAP